MKNYLKKFDDRPSTFRDSVLGIVKGKFFKKLSSTNKYFPRKCAWLSREKNILKEILLSRLYF